MTHEEMIAKLRHGIEIPPPGVRSYTDYTFDDCAAIAQDYPSRTAWKEADRQSYQAAYVFGWLEDCTEHMTGKRVRRTRAELCEA